MINFIVYFFMIIFIFLYNYIFGGESSVTILYALILMPLISILLTYPVKSRIEIFFRILSRELEKDGMTSVELTIKNKSIFPAPFIIISFIEALNLSISHPSNISIFLGPMQSKTITVEYKAKYRGVAKIGVKDIVLKDYMGFLKYSLLKDIKEKQNVGEVVVTPRLIHIKPNNKIFKSSDNIKQDAEETTNSLLTWSGEPGYEFRQYIPGDSLQKIHWKLSAKNDTLMVRKDEGSGVAKKLLIIDPYISIQGIERNQNKDISKHNSKDISKHNSKDISKHNSKNISKHNSKNVSKHNSKDISKHNSKDISKHNSKNISKHNRNEIPNIDEILMIEEKILEAAIAMANVNVISGREVDIWLFEEDKWNRYYLRDAKDISSLKYRLTQFEFKWSLDSKSIDRVPSIDIIAQSENKRHLEIGDAIIFTGTEDNVLANEINKLLNYGVSINIVMVQTFKDGQTAQKNILYSNIVLDNLWVIDVRENLDKAFL